jgi:nicotinate phosphoribosyltransferase
LNSGIINYLAVALAMIVNGRKPKGVRLDSGDLCVLSKECRKVINQVIDITGKKELNNIKIVASDGLNETKIKDFIQRVLKL